jgi:hypothetical protein
VVTGGCWRRVCEGLIMRMSVVAREGVDGIWEVRDGCMKFMPQEDRLTRLAKSRKP